MPKFIRKKRSFPGPPEGRAGDRPDRYGRPGTDARTRVGTAVRNDAGKHRRQAAAGDKKTGIRLRVSGNFCGPRALLFFRHRRSAVPTSGSGTSCRDPALKGIGPLRAGVIPAVRVPAWDDGCGCSRASRSGHARTCRNLPCRGRSYAGRRSPAFGIDRLATLRDGQEIVISSRSPDIEKIGAPTRLDCFREDLVFMKFLPFAARCK